MLTKEGKFQPAKGIYVLLVIFLAGLFVFWGFRVYEIWHNANGLYPREITIDAIGKAYVTPDVAEITIGVHTEGDKSDTVVKENTEKMNKVITQIKALGVDEKDIQTTSYYMNPKYVWIEGQGDVPKGYMIDQTILVKVRDLTKAGDVVAKATASGANTLGGIQFTVDDTEKAKTLARAEAIKNAEAKAKAIEEQTGFKLGKVIGYYEYSDDYYGKGGPVYMDAAMGEGGAASPSTEAGQQEIALTVNLTYRIK